MQEPELRQTLLKIHDHLVESHCASLKLRLGAHQAYLEAMSRIRDQIGHRWTRQSSTDPQPGMQSWSMSLGSDPWVVDHTPACTVPVLPLTYELDMMVRAVKRAFPGKNVSAVSSMESRRWAAFVTDKLDGRFRVQLASDGAVDVELEIQNQSGCFEPCASARISLGARQPSASWLPCPLEEPRPAPDPYRTGELFHGPAFQHMTDVTIGRNGASSRLSAERRGVPRGELHPGLLDAALHAVPFFQISRWYPEIGAGKVAFPCRIQSMSIHRSLPDTGTVQVEVRHERIDHGAFPVLRFWLEDEYGILLTFELTLVLVPLGPLAGKDQAAWKRFMEGQGAVRGLSLGQEVEAGRILHRAGAGTLQWLPGSLSRVFGLDPASPGHLSSLAIADHLGQELELHPSRIRVEEITGRCLNTPFNQIRIAKTVLPDSVETRIEGSGKLQLEQIRQHWYQRGVVRNLLSDLMLSLVNKFTRRIIIEYPEDFAGLEGRPVLYVANHQTAIESLTFCIAMVALARNPCRALTTRKQQQGMIGALIRMAEEFFGTSLALRLLVFSAEERESLFPVLDEYRQILTEEKSSLYVAAEGQRAHQANHPVRHLSSTFLDLALENEVPIVPVKFSGGLPQDPLPERLDFPFRNGQQDFYLGQAIQPAQLAGMGYAERPRLVMQRINQLGAELHQEMPIAPDPEFAGRVERLQKRGCPGLVAVLIESLKEFPEPSGETRAFLESVSLPGSRIPESDNPLIQLISTLMSSPRAGAI